MLELKYELRLPVTDERAVAIASFNFHERYFGTAFDISVAGPGDDEPAHSACAGVGLERFAYAFLCRHGIDPAGWPESVRQAMSAGDPARGNGGAR